MSSGTSTPRTASVTPTPPAGDPAPLTIGTRFVKQYYHEISTSPELIVRFYQPSTSVVTVGTGSDPATEVTDLAEAAAARFHQNDGPVRFEFEHGAIDAQLSVNGGVLLVVTGQMISSQARKSFVHTFFLGMTTAGSNSNKKSYFVHNDILRFLHQEENGAETPNPAVVDEDMVEVDDNVPPVQSLPLAIEELPAPVDTAAVVDDEITKDEMLQVVEQAVPAPAVSDSIGYVAVVVGEDAPGHGVEESKEALLADDDTFDASAVAPPKSAAAQPPGSWASLVARKTLTPPSTPNRSEKVNSNGTSNTSNNSIMNISSTNSAQQAPTPVKAAPEAPPPTSSTEPVTTAAPAAASSSTVDAPSDSTTSNANSKAPPHFQRLNKRDPDCTLVIKNIDFNATEAEVLALFTPFTTDTTAKVIGCTVQAHRGIAFVDYDSPEPVLKAVAQQTDVAAFVLRDRKLEIYQKTIEQRSRGGGNSGGRVGGRGGYRGGGRDYRGGGGEDGGGRGGGARYFRRDYGNRNHGGREGRGGGGGGRGAGTPTASSSGGR
jgi:Nuclear transport factor 2 (NTF2) domain/RNA recognition motif. (a.k.a. RRM, RBD, or RNP domain)